MRAPKKLGGGSPYTYGWAPPDKEWLEHQHVGLGKSVNLIVKDLSNLEFLCRSCHEKLHKGGD